MARRKIPDSDNQPDLFDSPPDLTVSDTESLVKPPSEELVESQGRVPDEFAHPEVSEEPSFGELREEQGPAIVTPGLDLGMLRYVGVIRHANYACSRDYGDVPSDTGREQMQFLIEKFREKTGRGSLRTQMVVSTAPRALFSAIAFARGIRAAWSETQFESYLWTNRRGEDCYENDRDREKPRALEMITRNNQNDALFLVSHYEFCNNFPSLFLERALNMDKGLEKTPQGQNSYVGVMGKGYLFLYDVEKQMYELIGNPALSEEEQ